MNNSLGDARDEQNNQWRGKNNSPLPIEMRDKIDQVEILEQKWSIETRSLGGVWVWDRDTVASSVDAASQLQVSL